MFLDEIAIQVKSGNGGRGCESHIRRADRKMIPNGGDGGSGGDVIIRSDSHTGSLFPLQSKRVFEAENGGLGKGSNMYGRNGSPLVLKVPCGTTIYNQSGNLLIRDLAEPDEEVMVAKGGRGGYGNHAGRPARPGEEGVLLRLLFSFAVISDIFLAGLPNSGKTALLKRLTGARVEPADYPFATKSPCLGTCTGEPRNFRICELPSLYAHSHEGRGLGNSFLKHLKRCRLLLLVLDPLNPFARGMKQGYDILIQAIEQFDAHFLNIPRFVVINKMDLKDAGKIANRKSVQFKDPHFKVSALTGVGLPKLMRESVRFLEKEKREKKSEF